MSDRLLSGKQIVGTSIFLLIGLLYLSTGFQVDNSGYAGYSLPELTLPDFKEAFKDKCGDVSPDKIKPCKVAKSYEQLTTDIFGNELRLNPEVMLSKIKIDNIPCDKLSSAYDNNAKWNLRDYVAWRYVNEC